jgi:hypothetical protein
MPRWPSSVAMGNDRTAVTASSVFAPLPVPVTDLPATAVVSAAYWPAVIVELNKADAVKVPVC